MSGPARRLYPTASRPQDRLSRASALQREPTTPTPSDPTHSATRILIADAQRWVAEGLRTVLVHELVHVTAIATTTDAALAAVDAYRPDVALLDVALPPEGGATTGHSILRRRPGTRVVLMTATDHTAAEAIVQASGFHGCVTKQMAPAAVLRAIRDAALGRGPGRAGWKQGPARTARNEGLTAREKEVLQALYEGASGREIAQCLRISENTVRTHVQNVLVKLHAGSRLEAVTAALRAGLVSPRDAGGGPAPWSMYRVR